MYRKDDMLRVAMMATALISLVFGFKAMIFNHAPGMFNAVEEDMSYAWYVPLFSLYVWWNERERIVASVSRPSVWGILASVPFLMLAFLGVRGVQLRFEILAFVGLLITVPWSLFGWSTARRVAPGAAFLLFCMPLTSFLDVITVHLRLLATSVAFAALEGFGAEVVRRGTMLAAENGSFAIDVAEPCSGLRSLFALMALTAAYAYMTQRTWLKRAGLFALSVPIAVAGNVVRILTICLVAATSSGEFATGFYHDYSGYVVFIVAILLMVSAGEVISRVGGRHAPASAPAAEAKSPAAPVHTGIFGWAVSAVATATVVLSMASLASSSSPRLCEPSEKRLAEIAGFTSERLDPSEAELKTLPGDTLFDKRRYVSDDGEWYLVTMVIGGRSKSSIHRPELCLPAQGFLMENAETVEAGGIEWRVMRLTQGLGDPQGFAYTFFNQDGFRTASHMRRIFRDVWDRSVYNRIDRWVMLTVNSSCADPEKLGKFLAELAEAVE